MTLWARLVQMCCNLALWPPTQLTAPARCRTGSLSQLPRLWMTMDRETRDRLAVNFDRYATSRHVDANGADANGCSAACQPLGRAQRRVPVLTHKITLVQAAMLDRLGGSIRRHDGQLPPGVQARRPNSNWNSSPSCACNTSFVSCGASRRLPVQEWHPGVSRQVLKDSGIEFLQTPHSILQVPAALKVPRRPRPPEDNRPRFTIQDFRSVFEASSPLPPRPSHMQSAAYCGLANSACDTAQGCGCKCTAFV